MERGFGLSAHGTITAEPLVKDEEAYRQKWVAVQRGDVLFHADTEIELIHKVRQAGLESGTYVIRFIDEPPRSFVVGVG
jgi:hypothetical protein